MESRYLFISALYTTFASLSDSINLIKRVARWTERHDYNKVKSSIQVDNVFSFFFRSPWRLTFSQLAVAGWPHKRVNMRSVNKKVFRYKQKGHFGYPSKGIKN